MFRTRLSLAIKSPDVVALSIIGLQPTLPTRVMGLRTIVLFIIVYRIVFLFTIFQSYTI